MIVRDCDACGTSYETASDRSKFCTGVECRRERARLRRRKADGKNVVPFQPVEEGVMTTAARVALTEAGVVDTDAGRLVISLAGRLDGSLKDTGSSYAALSREYRAARADAMRDAIPKADPIAELRAKATERRLHVVG